MTARAAIPRKPPKQLVDAIAGLKKFDEDFYLNLTEKQRKLEYKKEDKIFALGKRLGLQHHYIREILDKHHAVQMPCYDCKQKQVDVVLQCNEPKPGDREIIYEPPICSECKEKREHNEWIERNGRLRIKESKNPIISYCYKIRNEIPETEETWQQYKEDEAAAKENVGLYAQRITDLIENPRENPEVIFKRTGKYPDGSKNKTQWLKHLKNHRQLEKQRRQEAQADWKLRMNAPIHLLEKTIREIRCRCEPEDMRQGVFCDTCRLLVLVHKYMMNLFKEAAESKRS
jgi:hypothetical protein